MLLGLALLQDPACTAVCVLNFVTPVGAYGVHRLNLLIIINKKHHTLTVSFRGVDVCDCLPSGLAQPVPYPPAQISSRNKTESAQVYVISSLGFMPRIAYPPRSEVLQPSDSGTDHD